MIPQVPIANRNKEIIKSTKYLPRNVNRCSPNRLASNRDTIKEGVSTATQSMTRQANAVMVPTRASRYRGMAAKKMDTRILSCGTAKKDGEQRKHHCPRFTSRREGSVNTVPARVYNLMDSHEDSKSKKKISQRNLTHRTNYQKMINIYKDEYMHWQCEKK
jgi:hypothetical protein